MKFMHAIVDETPNISVVTKIEALRFNTSDDVYKTLHDFVSESIVFEINDQVVDKTITICKGQRIKLPDAIIAATAIVGDLTLITRNTSDFKNITDLELLDPWKQ